MIHWFARQSYTSLRRRRRSDAIAFTSLEGNPGGKVGNTTLEVLGLDEITICTKRVILEHFPTTGERQFRREVAKFQESGHPTLKTRDSILLRAKWSMLPPGTPGLMEHSIKEHCGFQIQQGLFTR